MNNNEIRQLVEVVSKMPPPLPFDWHKEQLSSQMTCKCGKRKNVDQLETLDTGVLRIFNNVCRDCPEAQKADRALARVVCCCCKQVVARMAPNTSPVGFKYEKNRTYHVDKCAACHPGLTESLILEELLHNRAVGKGRIKA